MIPKYCVKKLSATRNKDKKIEDIEVSLKEIRASNGILKVGRGNELVDALACLKAVNAYAVNQNELMIVSVE